MGGSHLLSLYNSTRASRTKRLTAACLHPFRRYGDAAGSNESRHKLGTGVVVEERAASTAEEFERVSEEKEANLDRRINNVKEKEKERQEGVAGQTSEKVHDEAEEAECMTDSVKEKYKKKPLGKGNFHNTADDGQ